jgi:hypothetical protein
MDGAAALAGRAARALSFMMTIFEKQRRAMNRSCLAKPKNLSPDGAAAYATVRAYLRATHSTYCGGCKAFYSPEEWKAREPHTDVKGVILVVMHDGGELSNVFNLDKGCVHLYDRMRSALNEAGFMAESMTAWYSYIYKSQKSYVQHGSAELPAVRPADQWHHNNVQVQHADNLHTL